MILFRAIVAAMLLAFITTGAFAAVHRAKPKRVSASTPKGCIYNNANYSDGAIICTGAGIALACRNGSWSEATLTGPGSCPK